LVAVLASGCHTAEPEPTFVSSSCPDADQRFSFSVIMHFEESSALSDPLPPDAPPGARLFTGAGWWSESAAGDESKLAVNVDWIPAGGIATASDAGADAGFASRCGSRKALLVEANKNRTGAATFGTTLLGYVSQPQIVPSPEANDAGAGVDDPRYTNRSSCDGNYAPGNVSGAGFEGLSFWANVEGNENVSVRVALADQRTLAEVQPIIYKSPDEICVRQDAGGFADFVPFVPEGGAPPECPPRANELLSEDEDWDLDASREAGVVYKNYCSPCPNSGSKRCGSYFSADEVIAPGWNLYTVPFRKMTQSGSGRHFSQIDVEHLRILEIHLAADQRAKVWLDDFAFYRKK
jgi:hypothetical protein